MFFLILHMSLKYVSHLLVLLDAEEKDGACDALQSYCRSAGAEMHGPLPMGVSAVIFSRAGLWVLT